MKKGINVPLLRKVQKFLLAEPRRFDMTEWINPSEYSNVLKEPPCGTACCIAGATYLIAKKITPCGEIAGTAEAYEVSLAATKALIIDSDQESRLYLTSGWPKRFQKAYHKAKTPLARAKAGVARIEHFIKTKGAE